MRIGLAAILIATCLASCMSLSDLCEEYPRSFVVRKWIETVHDPAYIHRFEEVCLSGNRTFDYPDNQMCVVSRSGFPRCQVF